MHEELIKRLINEAECPDNYPEDSDLMREAADAIAELSAYVQMLEELRKDGWYLQKTKMMTYGQATMTRPLPEPPKEGK